MIKMIGASIPKLRTNSCIFSMSFIPEFLRYKKAIIISIAVSVIRRGCWYFKFILFNILISYKVLVCVTSLVHAVEVDCDSFHIDLVVSKVEVALHCWDADYWEKD